ncbi:MAG: hypothetical protein H7641_08400 [Candidatus Heimdallarchaeota archaeon]|nr:hypothetical protein [Candidatus Heimdallarchaeota archaeon]MCK4877587.1 hypothetical protein [Candidatus Heimdallarchaeota archaeon]
MFQDSDESLFVQKERLRVLTIFFLLLLNAIVYFIPYRNNVLIGELFGITLWFYFGVLNALLLILVYTLVKGQVILDFSSKKFIFNEFKKKKSWDFSELLGIYLLAYEGKYLIRVRPQRLLTLDIQVSFEHAYKILEKFEELGYKFKTVRSNEPKRITYPFPVLFSKFEKRSGGFNPEIPEWYRGITQRTKLISITISPLLYVVGGTLIARMPYLVEGLSSTKGIVYFIYVFTVFLLFDGGLYFLFGVSFLVVLAKQIRKVSSVSHSRDKL